MEDRNKDSKIEENKKFKIYEDYKSFQGLSFENNINSINKLLFGSGLKISDIPFLIKEENNDKKILALNRIKINSKSGNKIICYPKKCIYTVFYYEKFYSILYLTDNNNLEIYKLNSRNITKYIVPNDKVKNPKIIEIILNCDELENIFKDLENIKEQNNILENYNNLCNILKYKLKLKLEKTRAKKQPETLNFKFCLNDFDFSVEIKSIEEEVDDVGLIREKLNIKKGKITLKEGIISVIEYAKLKKEKNQKATEFTNNSFKCPILFKNFDEETISENQTLLIEIKSGFEIDGVAKQINERINLINDCFFKEGEKPTFFIGLINLDSDKIELLSKYIDSVLNFEKNTLIISCIDFEYCGIDSSYEVNTDYLLYKELKKLEAKVEENKNEIKEEIKEIKGEIKGEINGLNVKFDSLIEALQKVIPGIKVNFNEILKIKTKEETKNSQ